MKTVVLSLLTTAILISQTYAHGSQGYAPDSYYRIAVATDAVDLSTNQKVPLPIGELILVLWFGKEVAYFETQDGHGQTYYMLWDDLFKQDYLGMGVEMGRNRPF